jgi:hypothetical protein
MTRRLTFSEVEIEGFVEALIRGVEALRPVDCAKHACDALQVKCHRDSHFALGGTHKKKCPRLTLRLRHHSSKRIYEYDNIHLCKTHCVDSRPTSFKRSLTQLGSPFLSS